MANKKISELTLLDTVSANLQLTVLPVLDTTSGTTRKVTLQQLNDSIEANIPFAAAAFTQANTANLNALSSGSYANAAFIRANNTLNVSTGGTVTGDLTITGNVSISGCTATLSVSTFRTSDHIIDIGYGTVGVASQNAGVRVFRGDENPVQLRWNEVSNKWQYTNDGSEYFDFSDVTSGQLSSAYSQANTANVNAISSGVYANSAFQSSNTADQKAVSAGDYANSAFSVANSVSSLSDSWARDAANSASSYANAAFSVANTSNASITTVGEYANSAFSVANNSVDSWARDSVNSASSYANSAYSLSNTSNIIATSASSYANAAFAAANSATSTIDSWARDSVNSASSYANSSYAAANTADQKAVSAGDYANSSYVAANTADQKVVTSGDYANSSYTAANTADQRAVTSGNYANSAYGAANTVSSLISGNDLIVTGNVVTNKLTYSSNSSVTQTTSRGTGVTLNTNSGDIILYADSMTSGQVDAIALTNNKARAGDLILCSVEGGSVATYIAGGYCSTDGIIIFWIRNITSSTTSSESPKIRFILVKPTNV